MNGVYVCAFYKYCYFQKIITIKGVISIFRFLSILFNVIIFLIWKGVIKMFWFYVYALLMWLFWVGGHRDI